MEDHDVEVFERIPWESLEQNPNRRWIPYLVATAVVLGAVGVTIGRGMNTPPVEPTVLAPTTAPTPDSTTEPVAGGKTLPEATIPSPQESTWSEADLMALPDGAVEIAAMAVAEWFVVENFTREDGEGGRSFVDWVRAGELTWMNTTTIDVTVLVRRLAAEGDHPYQRLPVEAWGVTTELEGDGWLVTHGPVPLAPPTLGVSVPSLDGHVPDEVAAATGGDPIVGAAQIDENGWSVGVEWTDAAGLTWVVRDRVEKTPDE